MTARIQRVRLRGILDSRGQVTPEAEVRLIGDFVGTASCPVAIAPGRREKTRAKSLDVGTLGPADPLTDVIGKLEGKTFNTQCDFDALLEDLQAASRAGADVTLAYPWHSVVHAPRSTASRCFAIFAGCRTSDPQCRIRWSTCSAAEFTAIGAMCRFSKS